jgi:4'-phosphopantetheinyl transferase EntD
MRQVPEGWYQLVPPGVSVSAGCAVAEPQPLTATEAASSGAMSAERMWEFTIGRDHAKRALNELGVPAELPVGPNRAPLWPTGVTGSITHTHGPGRSYFAAAVAKTSDIRKIGIDAEYITALPSYSWRQFMTKREIELIRSMPVASRRQSVVSIWCSKEAACKALGESIDPLQFETGVAAERSDPGAWQLELNGHSMPVLARTVCFAEIVLAAVILYN